MTQSCLLQNAFALHQGARRSYGWQRQNAGKDAASGVRRGPGHSALVSLPLLR